MVFSRPKGLPIATATCPTLTVVESPTVIGVSANRGYHFDDGQVAIRVSAHHAGGQGRAVCKVISMLLAPLTTWLLVTM